MYSQTNPDDDFYAFVLCGCGRKFKPEEMYICYNCNKVLCQYCLDEEIEVCFCKNFCKRNQSMSANQAKKNKNTCDQCMQCPVCQTILVKRKIAGKYAYACTFCYWNTIDKKLYTEKETELDNLIFQLKDTSNKGYLKKMYDHLVTRLKKNEQLNTIYLNNDNISASAQLNAYLNNDNPIDVSNDVNNAMNEKTWDLKCLEEKILTEENDITDNSMMKYEDNYISDLKNYSAFQMVGSFIACNIDYTEKYNFKADTIDGIKDRLRYLDVGNVSNLDQRYSNLTFQHPMTNNLFPTFTEILPKKSKRCKFCKKFVVQMEDTLQSKKQYQKLDLCHLFIKQFPVCYIYKIEPKEQIIYLKFVLMDLKEIKIAFKEADDSPISLNIPKGRYDLKYSLTQSGPPILDNYILSEGDRFIIFKFSWNQSEEFQKDVDSLNLNPDNISKTTPKKRQIFFRFILNVEYPRTEPVEIDYKMEIKFTI